MLHVLRQIARTGIVTEPAPAADGDMVVVRRLQEKILKTLGRALTIRQVDAGSCNGCELEIHALCNPYYNIEGLGIRFVASPRHADLLLVTGPVSRHMAIALQRTYDATPEPKLVVAVGDCGCTGGIFGEGYASLGRVANVIPVDVEVPGCPPAPTALLQGILAAIGRSAAKPVGRDDSSTSRSAKEEPMGKTISCKRPDGKPVDGYLAEPGQGAGAPGIVVIQEWWGLNDQIKGVADRLAAAGYRAFVPDLYRGKVALQANEAEHLMNDLNFGDAAGQDVRGAVLHLKATGSAKVGVTGFCMGGALTLLSAVNVPELDAAVTWYGYPPLEYVDASKIRVPLMGHWAEDDVPFPIAKVADLEQMLRGADVAFEFHRYPAKHAFANETADSKNLAFLKYDPAAAELAWRRTMDFLARHLK